LHSNFSKTLSIRYLIGAKSRLKFSFLLAILVFLRLLLLYQIQIILQYLILLRFTSILLFIGSTRNHLLKILSIYDHSSFQVSTFDAGQHEINFDLAISNDVDDFDWAEVFPGLRGKAVDGFTTSLPILTMLLSRHLHQHFYQLLIFKLLPESKFIGCVITYTPKLQFLLKHSLFNRCPKLWPYAPITSKVIYKHFKIMGVPINKDMSFLSILQRMNSIEHFLQGRVFYLA